MKLLRYISTLFFVLTATINFAHSKPAAIIAQINDQIITLQELENRVWFAKKFNTDETKNLSKKSLTYNILDELIEEMMINLEAKRVGLSISEKEFSVVMNQIKYGQAKLYKKIKSSRRAVLANQILEDKIRTNLIWSKILSEIVKPSVKNINKAQIIETLEQLDRDTQEYKFDISQLSMEKSDNNKIFIDKIYDELISGQENSEIVDFIDLGWVSKSDLDTKIYQSLIKTKGKKYTKPVDLGKNYAIFKINEKTLSNNISDQDYELAQNKIYKSLKISDGQGFLRNLKKRTFIEIYKNRIDEYLNL